MTAKKAIELQNAVIGYGSASFGLGNASCMSIWQPSAQSDQKYTQARERSDKAFKAVMDLLTAEVIGEPVQEPRITLDTREVNVFETFRLMRIGERVSGSTDFPKYAAKSLKAALESISHPLADTPIETIIAAYTAADEQYAKEQAK